MALHRLTDGGSLIRVGDVSHTVYMKEEIERYVVTISGKTCEFDKENDPTIMRASSAGKLIRYLVEDGDHVKTGDAFAEVEVRACDERPLVCRKSLAIGPFCSSQLKTFTRQ